MGELKKTVKCFEHHFGHGMLILDTPGSLYSILLYNINITDIGPNELRSQSDGLYFGDSFCHLHFHTTTLSPDALPGTVTPSFIYDGVKFCRT
jgi:hypothetical protein